MKRNKWMLISGLVIALGGTSLTPMVAGVVYALIGESRIKDFFRENPDYEPIAIMALVAVAVSPFIIGMFLIMGSVLIPLFSSIRSKNKILSQGVPAEARILALNETGTRINHDPLVSFTLEVYSPTQAPFRAEVRQTISILHLPSYQPGKILDVKFMPGTHEVAIVGPKYG